MFNPRHQSWNDHFAWIDSGTRVLGKTPVGRATEKALRLNRSPLVDSRKIWGDAGRHPPGDSLGLHSIERAMAPARVEFLPHPVGDVHVAIEVALRG